MSGRPTREAVLSALFWRLVAALQISFTADTTANDPVLANVSTTSGLFVGLPVTGGTIPAGSVISVVSPLTLSIAPTGDATAVAMNTGFAATGRRVVMWNDQKEQPALFLRPGKRNRTDYDGIVLSQRTLEAELWVYTNAGQDPDAVPSIALDNILDALESVFAPDDPQTNRFTIGGLVHWCQWGEETLEPGDIDGQAIAVVDITIIVP